MSTILERTIMTRTIKGEAVEVENMLCVERKTECGKMKGLKQLWQEEDGMGTVEIILIIVVLVGLVLVFKEQITDIVDNLFDKITKQTGKV